MPSYKLLTEVEPTREAGADKPSASAAYASTQFQDVQLTIPGVDNLYQMFRASVEKYPANKCLGHRPAVEGGAGDYVWSTYAETGAKVDKVAGGLMAIGVTPKSTVGVYGPNSPEWMVSMQACNRQSLICVPLYDTLGESAMEYIFKHAEIGTVFAYGGKLPQLADALKGLKGLVTNVIYWGDGNPGKVQELKDSGFSVYTFDEVMRRGEENPADPVAAGPDETCTIMYTSGTTGDPKGVVLTHGALISVVQSTKAYLGGYCSFGEDDVATEELFLNYGAAIGYWQGNRDAIADDISKCKPTLFAGVPRVFDRFYARVMGQVKGSSFLKKTLFNYAYRRKLSFMQNGRKSTEASPFFDFLVFSKLKNFLGGQVKLIVSGGAPIPLHTEEFLRVCFCCPVSQGYGLTETCAASVIAVPDSIEHMGTVGIPAPVTQLRLESVPEMNYDALAEEPKGEILLKGINNFKGYYKNEKGTSEVLEKDGWFHTGDIGTLIRDGALKIIDRKKNIFKLAQGEYIAVEKVEEIYKKCSAIDQIWVYGNSEKHFLIAVVIPHQSYVAAWAAENGKQGVDEAEIVKDEDFKKKLFAEMKQVAQDAKLKGFESVKALHVDMEPFSVENDTLTPTFKLKRPQLLKQYQEKVDAIYAQ